MNLPRWRWLAILPFLATVALLTWNVVSVPIRGGLSIDFLSGLMAFLSALAFAAIGSYLAYRLPHNVIGWLMTVYALVFAFSLWSEAAAEEGRLLAAAAQWAAWLGSFSWAVNGITITVLIPLLFPDGRLPSPRWRWVLWTAASSFLLLFAANAFSPEATAPVVNPLGQAAWTDALSTVGLVGFVLFLTSIAGTVVAVVGRFRRSRGAERTQMQVFAFGAVTIATGAISTYALYELGYGAIAQLVMATVSLVVPAAIGVAVLKYRLYDLDRIVKRTVTYSAIAIVLVAVYGLSVIGLQAILGTDDSLSVAASTLAAAALFNPVRTRMQRLVERRFDRSRYDAALIVEAFSARISQEVDIDLLQSDLSGLVRRTLRPSDVSLWVRGPST